MNKLGPPMAGFDCIRRLTKKERRITGLSNRWCIGKDGRWGFRFYERNGSGYNYGYGPVRYWGRMNALWCFWDGLPVEDWRD